MSTKRIRNVAEARKEFLEMAAEIEGIYVPAFYDVTYKEDGTIESFRPNQSTCKRKDQEAGGYGYERVQRIRRSRSFRLSRQHRTVLFLRFREAVSADAVSARQECYTVRPREKDVEVLKDYAYKMLKSTGHEEISLSSLSSSDYSHLRELVNFLIDELQVTGDQYQSCRRFVLMHFLWM